MTEKTPGQAAYEARLAAWAARLGIVRTPNWDGLEAGARADWEAGVQAAINAHELAAECDPSALDRIAAERDKAYRERAALVAYLAACYGGTLAYGDSDDEWPVIFIETPAGQMSWHIAGTDVEMFRALGLKVTVGEAHWDGHTTEVKYERLADMTARIARSGGFAGVVAAMASARPAPLTDGSLAELKAVKRILNFLDNQDTFLPAGTIARRTRVSLPLAERALDKLETAGLVDTGQVDPDDLDDHLIGVGGIRGYRLRPAPGGDEYPASERDAELLAYRRNGGDPRDEAG